jgi:uncharacterized repeat protein (TIGR04042 family)
MQGILFDVRWPDGSLTTFYAPSSIVRMILQADRTYAIDELLTRSRAALGAASERVRLLQGEPSERAAVSLADLVSRAHAFGMQDRARIEGVRNSD